MKNSKVIFQFVNTCHSGLTNPIREQCVSRPFVVADVYATQIRSSSPPRGLATLVVVGGPSTRQDSHLTGKRGASQGSPLRVAPRVPSGSGWGPRALYRAIMRSTFIRLGRGVVHLGRRIIVFAHVDVTERGRDECPSSKERAFSSPCLRRWWSLTTKLAATGATAVHVHVDAVRAPGMKARSPESS